MRDTKPFQVVVKVAERSYLEVTCLSLNAFPQDKSLLVIVECKTCISVCISKLVTFILPFVIK